VEKTYVQAVTGTLLYYAQVVDSTILMTLNAIATQQAAPTESTMEEIKQLLDYCATWLPIPVWQESIFGAQKQEKTGFLRISFFSCVFWRNFSQERGFGGGRRNSCFLPLSQEFFAGITMGQEFLRIPPDSCSRQMLSCSGQQLK
jgi:hypothetical protein